MADDALLVMEADEVRLGPVDAVMSETNLSALYGTPLYRRTVAIEGHGSIETVVSVP